MLFFYGQDISRGCAYLSVCVHRFTIGGLQTAAEPQSHVGLGQKFSCFLSHGHHTLGQHLCLLDLDTYKHISLLGMLAGMNMQYRNEEKQPNWNTTSPPLYTQPFKVHGDRAVPNCLVVFCLFM